MHERLSNGRKYRLLTVIDAFSRECVTLEIAYGSNSMDVIDLRRAVASLTSGVGVSIKEVQTLLDHSSPVVMLSVYARLIEGLGRQAVKELARSVLGPRRA